MDNKKIEFWENHYLNQIEFNLKQDLNKMIEGLKSKDKIKKDWFDIFNSIDKKRQNSDFARGAERIYYWLFNQFGTPNSSPIGADMMFELYNAFIHIDIKTAKLDNTSDYKGKIPIGENQTSYKSDHFDYSVHLPSKYSFKDKLCLTYFINIIYDVLEENIEILAIILISVPNGELSKVYGDKIVEAGKTGYSGKGFRYKYSENPYFELIDGKPKRLRILYVNEDEVDDIDDLIGL